MPSHCMALPSPCSIACSSSSRPRSGSLGKWLPSISVAPRYSMALPSPCSIARSSSCRPRSGSLGRSVPSISAMPSALRAFGDPLSAAVLKKANLFGLYVRKYHIPSNRDLSLCCTNFSMISVVASRSLVDLSSTSGSVECHWPIKLAMTFGFTAESSASHLAIFFACRPISRELNRFSRQ